MSTLAFKENCSSFLFSLSPQDFFTSACYEQFLLLMVRYSTKVFIWIGGTSSGEQHLGNSTNIELQPRMLCFVTRLNQINLMCGPQRYVVNQQSQKLWILFVTHTIS
ncbi:unnamed protein product [Lactuca virosa]|uniref:Gelsolin-like domain-containing protein n=1 Tax=Lactuca virosa TaxID=75947 RepID=A0AAU9NQJ7_9ASTR|nr:unnamed protein product [Lactuca virosa]